MKEEVLLAISNCNTSTLHGVYAFCSNLIHSQDVILCINVFFETKSQDTRSVVFPVNIKYYKHYLKMLKENQEGGVA